MWANRKTAALVLAAAMALGLAGCVENVSTGEVLIQPVEAGRESTNLKLAEVTVGDVSQTYSNQDGVLKYQELPLTCDIDGAKFVEYAVSSGDIVEKGDLIATFSVEYSRADQQSLEAELTIAKSSAERVKKSAADAKAAAKSALDGYSGEDARARRRLELALERAEINEKLTACSTRLSVKMAQEALDSFNERLENTELRAPVDGYIAKLEFKQQGAGVDKGAWMGTIVSFNDLSITGECLMANAIRYGAPAVLQAWMLGVEKYDSEVISAPNTSGQKTGHFSVNLPEGVDELMAKAAVGDAGDRQLQRSMGIRIESQRYGVEGVVIVPNDAVFKEDAKRYVYVMRDGDLKKRYISTGLNDDKNTQVLEGLEPGERVQIG